MFPGKLPEFHLRCTQVALVALASALLYAPVALMLIHTWWGTSGRDDYGHGFIIVLIVLYLVWRQRDELTHLRMVPSFAFGIPVTLLAACLLLAGKLTTTAVLEQISLLVMLPGLLFLLGGTASFRILAFPLVFLAFAIPLFDEVIASFHWPLQLLAADIGAWLLRLVGIPVYRETQYLYLPRITLEIADACSGVRYMISVITLAIPLAYLTLPTWRRRSVLMAFAIVIAILANGLRVALIGLWVQHAGTGIIHGPLHILHGLFVSWVGFAAIFSGAWYLRRHSNIGKNLTATRKQTFKSAAIKAPSTQHPR